MVREVKCCLGELDSITVSTMEFLCDAGQATLTKLFKLSSVCMFLVFWMPNSRHLDPDEQKS